MSVIFLDIDGVMLPGRAYALPENLRRQLLLGKPGNTGDLLDCLPVDFDPVAVALVNRMAEISRARIVLHSDWRRHYDKDVLLGHLVNQGLSADRIHVDWWLEAPVSQRKQEAIAAWLEAGVPISGDLAPRFVVLDDDSIFEPSHDLADASLRRRLQDLACCHVKVDGEIGLTLADYHRALAILRCADPALVAGSLGR